MPKTPPQLKACVVRVANEDLEEKSRHITFHVADTQTPAHASIPVTPNTGRYLSAPVLPSPAASTTKPNAKRRVAFITLANDDAGGARGGRSGGNDDSGSNFGEEKNQKPKEE